MKRREKEAEQSYNNIDLLLSHMNGNTENPIRSGEYQDLKESIHKLENRVD